LDDEKLEALKKATVTTSIAARDINDQLNRFNASIERLEKAQSSHDVTCQSSSDVLRGDIGSLSRRLKSLKTAQYALSSKTQELDTSISSYDRNITAYRHDIDHRVSSLSQQMDEVMNQCRTSVDDSNEARRQSTSAMTAVNGVQTAVNVVQPQLASYDAQVRQALTAIQSLQASYTARLVG
jgi:chromosome segregation ATPase